MADARRTVWILGAGFSRSLGGPLLPDLLSPPTNNFVQAIYGGNRYIGAERPAELNADCEAARVVRELYRDCGGATAQPGTRFWDDAEAFLDQVDAAAHGGEGSPAGRRLTNAFQLAFPGMPKLSTYDLLRDAARRLVAGACCAFVKDADPNEER
jgi:hypothetical protein